MDKLTEYAAELQSLAQAGLFYGKDVYDRERYARIRDIAAEIMAMKTELPLGTVKELFCSDYGYQTPKVDTRADVNIRKLTFICFAYGDFSAVA